MLPTTSSDAWAEAFRILVTSGGPQDRDDDRRAQRGRPGSRGEASSRRSSYLNKQRILRTTVAAEPGGPARHEIYHDVLASAILDWRSRHAEKRAEAQEAERLTCKSDKSESG